jgi:hypothetical protein
MKKSSLRWLLFLFPLVVLAPVINRFIYSLNSTLSDLTISFYPNVLLVHNTVFQYHTLPFWSDLFMGGYPLVGDPMSGLWYAPTWLPNLFPSALSFNLIIIFHLVLAGVGMALFLKREGLSDFSALVGGLVFEMMPKIWAEIGPGHYTLIMAVSWTPWLLLAQKEFILSGYSWKRILYPGIVFGFMILANPVWAPYAAILWVAYAIVAGFQNRRDHPTRISRWLLKTFGGGILQGVLALLISAPLWLPLTEFTRLSSRSLMTIADRLIYSLPPANLLNLLIPNIEGRREWVVYLGVFPLFFIVLALWKSRKQPLTLFWGVTAGVALLVCLGSYFPLVSSIYQLPLFDLLRVSTKFYFLVCVVASILCAFGIESLVSRQEKPSKGFIRFWVALALFAIIISTSVSVITHSFSLQFAWAIVLFGISLLFLFLWGRGRFSSFRLGIVALVLIASDILGINMLGFSFIPETQVFSQGAEVAAFLKTQPGDFRVYSPSYSLPQHTAAKYGIHLLSGVDPLMLMSYVDFMEKATGIPVTHYSVTMPDFPNDSLSTDNSGYVPDARLLGLMNVRFVVSEFDISTTGLNLVKTLGTTRIYENQDWLSLAWVQPETSPFGEEVLSALNVIATPNDFKIEAKGPGKLVLSEVYYPGWYVYIDGIKEPISQENGIVMSAQLNAGNHSVEFVFHPTLVLLALIIAGLAWVGIVVYLRISEKQGGKSKNREIQNN